MAGIEDLNNAATIKKLVRAALWNTGDVVGAWLEGRIVTRIDHQLTRPTSWKPLAPSTVRKKRRKAGRRRSYGAEKAWVDTGELRTKITHSRAMEHGHVTVRVGVFDEWNAKKATWVEFGTTRLTENGRVQAIPERPLFRLVVDEEREQLGAVIRKAIVLSINKEIGDRLSA